MKHLTRIRIGLCAAVLIAGCATNKGGSSELTGFLGDYSDLEPVKGEGGEEVRRWVTSRNIKGEYPKLIVDPVAFYPEPQPTEQIPIETLEGLRRYTDMALRRELEKSYLLVNQVGPGVARVRLALTGIVTSPESLKFYEYIPTVAVLAGVSTAVGERDRVAYILVEALVTDSVTGEKLGMAVRKTPGKKLLADSKEKLTLELMQSVIDDKARNARLIFDRVLK